MARKPGDGQVELSASELRSLSEKYLFTGRYGAFDTGDEPPVIVRASGSYIADTEGRQYLDLNAGQTCAALGHNHEAVVAAITHAADTALHLSHAFPHKQEILLAAKLISIAPAPLEKCHFLMCGADANEAAIGIARLSTGHYDVAVPDRGFHGLSDATRALTMTAGKRRGYPIRPSGVHSIMTPYCYRCPIQKKFPECNLACLDVSFERIDAQRVEGLAAVITEPVFAAAGAIVPPKGWLAKLRELAHERDARLIVDEVVMFARTGEWWAFSDEIDAPDLVTLGKHFGGGVAIGAVITSKAIAESAEKKGFEFIHSNSSDPLPTGAARAVVEAIETEGLLRRVLNVSRILREGLEELAKAHRAIGDIRGRGILQAIELVKDPITKEPATDLADFVRRRCFQRGILVKRPSMRGSKEGNIIRLAPAMTIETRDIERTIASLDEALRAANW
jgi:2,2-dialkylglycine decarboxylase (pyruvate)